MRWYKLNQAEELEFARLYETAAYPHKVLEFAQRINPALTKERFWREWSHMNFVVQPLNVARKRFIQTINPYKESS